MNTRALLRTLRAVLMAPVTVTIVIPVVLALTVGTHSIAVPLPVAVALLAVGVVLVVAGVALEAWVVILFHQIGKGTLSPLDPTHLLVVVGPYRHVRNPMFTAVFAILGGEAIATRFPVLLVWFAVFVALVVLVVPRVEEPRLARRFGDDYARYRDNVPGWLPRLRPWQPATAHDKESPPC